MPTSPPLESGVSSGVSPPDSQETLNSVDNEIDPLPKNFGLMALYQVVMRTGWIFKTETIIMPAVIDVIAGPAWVRGCLPVFNRFGQSIPPLLASGWVRAKVRKKYALATTSFLMGITFWAVAGLWLVTGGQKQWWMPAVFLLFYAIFFASTGVNMLISSTLTGKLILPNRRGRLMAVSNTIGVISAVGCAWILLQKWLTEDSGNFFAIFAFAGSCFLAAGAVSLLFVEQRDTFEPETNGFVGLFRAAANTLASDREFRKLALVAALFSMSTTLFPHYQALGRQRLHLGFDVLMLWVIAQNVGLTIMSIPAGWFADRYGNRIVLRSLLLTLCVAPVLSLVLSRQENFGGACYFLVFCFVGAIPVTLRTFQHYCLELAPREDQPRYLSTLSLAFAAPAVLTSPLIGALLDVIGFETVFLFVVGCLLVGWWVSRTLVEPRVVID